MANITYLFGAGASAQALPVVRNFPQGIKEAYEKISKDEYKLSDTEKFMANPMDKNSKEKWRLEFIEDLKWLHQVSENHSSVDTYAKKLYLRQSSNDLRKLKAVLSAYLVIAQITHPYDKRYDSFLASIIGEGMIFPNNIKLLSWNYDSQFEIAYSDFQNNEKRNPAISANLQVSSKYCNTHFDAYRFGLFKINGTTTLEGSRGNAQEYFTEHVEDDLTVNVLEEIIWRYVRLSYGVKCLLSFAWENEFNTPGIIDKVIKATSDTSVLVVIGYSFPFFNREVDRKIIGAMKNLEKVYFQDKRPHDIKLRFQAIRNDIQSENLVLYDDVEQFLLPMEL